MPQVSRFTQAGQQNNCCKEARNPSYMSGYRLVNAIWKSEKSMRNGRIRQGEGMAEN